MLTPICTPRALIALAAVALLGPACQQPLVNCTSAHSPYAALYKLKKGDANSPCGALPGDVLTLNTYFQTGGLNGTPNYDKAKVAITSTYLAGFLDTAESYDPPVVDPDPKHTRNAIGDFIGGKPVDDFCVVDKYAAAIVDLPELPLIPEVPEVPEVPDDPNTPEDEHMDAIPGEPEVPAVPPQSFRFDWTDFRVLVTADAQGTQFSGHVKYTMDGCVAEYDVLAVSPAIYCEGEEEMVVDGETVTVPSGKPDQSICDDEANGINPSFATKCDPDFLYCVITREPPVYRE